MKTPLLDREIALLKSFRSQHKPSRVAKNYLKEYRSIKKALAELKKIKKEKERGITITKSS